MPFPKRSGPARAGGMVALETFGAWDSGVASNVIHVADLVVVPCSCHFSVHSISMQNSEDILLTPLLAVMWSWHFGNNGVGRQLFC